MLHSTTTQLEAGLRAIGWRDATSWTSHSQEAREAHRNGPKSSMPSTVFEQVGDRQPDAAATEPTREHRGFDIKMCYTRRNTTPRRKTVQEQHLMISML